MHPNVLLLTGITPGTQGVGQLFLYQSVLEYPKDKISCFALVEKGMRVNVDDLQWLPTSYLNRPRETGFIRFGKLIGKVSSFIVWNYTRIFKIPKIISAIESYGKKQKSEVLWVILSTPLLIFLARKVANQLNIELVVTIWDPPKMITENLRLTNFDQRKILVEFEKVLKNTTRCGVASENMANEYKLEYGITPVIQMMPAPCHLFKRSTNSVPINKENFTIGFGGSFYTMEVWESLLNALNKIDWILCGRRVILKLLSTQMPLEVKYIDQVEYLGWHDVDETLNILSEADILYLPYWFDEQHSDYVRLCFPGKMGTYLKTSRPILFHGPENSTVAKFIKTHPVGICCYSMDPKEIILCLKRFLQEPDIYNIASLAAEKVTNEELSQSYFKKNFEILMGVH